MRGAWGWDGQCLTNALPIRVPLQARGYCWEECWDEPPGRIPRTTLIGYREYPRDGRRGICEPQSWIQGYSGPVGQSVHLPGSADSPAPKATSGSQSGLNHPPNRPSAPLRLGCTALISHHVDRLPRGRSLNLHSPPHRVAAQHKGGYAPKEGFRRRRISCQAAQAGRCSSRRVSYSPSAETACCPARIRAALVCRSVKAP